VVVLSPASSRCWARPMTGTVASARASAAIHRSPQLEAW